MFVTPGSQTTRWLSRSTSRIRRMRVRTMSTPSSIGSAPPDSPLPDPRATHGTPGAVAHPDDRGDLVADAGEHRRASGCAAYCSRPSDS